MVRPAPPVALEDIRKFWEASPLASAAIPHPPGTPEYFAAYDALREANESPAFSAALHEYEAFAGKRVLDVGCGNGYVLERYARAGARVVGVDLTAAAARISRARFSLAGLRGTFRVADAEALPFPDGVFDLVCSMGVLHHVPRPENAVAEIRRVLRPGGRLIAMVYHRNSAWYRIHMPLRRLFSGTAIREQVNEVDGAGNPKGDVYTGKEFRGLLAGFAVTESFAGLLEGWMLVPKLGRTLLPARIGGRLERRLGWFLYAKATRL